MAGRTAPMHSAFSGNGGAGLCSGPVAPSEAREGVISLLQHVRQHGRPSQLRMELADTPSDSLLGRVLRKRRNGLVEVAPLSRRTDQTSSPATERARYLTGDIRLTTTPPSRNLHQKKKNRGRGGKTEYVYLERGLPLSVATEPHCTSSRKTQVTSLSAND